MAIDNDDQPGGGVSPSRRLNLRRRIAVGVVGAVAALGVGAYAITSHVVGQDSTAIRDTEAPAPMVSAGPTLSSAAVASGSPSVSAPGSLSVGASASSAAKPSKAVSRAPLGPAVQKQIDEARAAAKARRQVTKPLPPPRKVVPDSAVSTRIMQTKASYLRITTARADLKNQKDQRMAADEGTKTGNVNCTQRFHFASNAKPRVIPNMMICWRVSASRSVVTLGVTYKGKPSMSTYADVIAREWAKLR